MYYSLNHIQNTQEVKQVVGKKKGLDKNKMDGQCHCSVLLMEIIITIWAAKH